METLLSWHRQCFRDKIPSLKLSDHYFAPLIECPPELFHKRTGNHLALFLMHFVSEMVSFFAACIKRGLPHSMHLIVVPTLRAVCAVGENFILCGCLDGLCSVDDMNISSGSVLLWVTKSSDFTTR